MGNGEFDEFIQCNTFIWKNRDGINFICSNTGVKDGQM